jgi:hypothetical protein
VVADPAALRALIEGWVERPTFEAKLHTFLSTALQQDFVGALEDQLDKPRGQPAAGFESCRPMWGSSLRGRRCASCASGGH